MNHILYEIGLWSILVAVTFMFLVMDSFLVFGGKITFSVQLKGPLRFLSTPKPEEGDAQ